MPAKLLRRIPTVLYIGRPRTGSNLAHLNHFGGGSHTSERVLRDDDNNDVRGRKKVAREKWLVVPHRTITTTAKYLTQGTIKVLETTGS